MWRYTVALYNFRLIDHDGSWWWAIPRPSHFVVPNASNPLGRQSRPLHRPRAATQPTHSTAHDAVTTYTLNKQGGVALWPNWSVPSLDKINGLCYHIGVVNGQARTQKFSGIMWLIKSCWPMSIYMCASASCGPKIMRSWSPGTCYMYMVRL